MSGDARRQPAALVALGALGVVFGDIGTSPLYALRAVLGTAVHVDRASVYGLTSTVVWSLTIVVSVLYVGNLMSMDNDGEGGLLALLTLVRRRARGRLLTAATIVGMLGAALFLGDGLVTPAISVLSASEGIGVVDPSLTSYALPASVVILIGVFVLQRVGSGRIGNVYGPVMLVWFLTIGAAGAAALVRDPGALQVLSPTLAVGYFVAHPLPAFLALGSVVLTFTGAEALYADLGHFTRKAIARSWFGLVFPALILAYVGEAAAVAHDPSQAGQPFYSVVPAWARIPVLVLATLATIIASEAVIAGAFTVVHQAGGLGLLPRLRTRHPSEEGAGRIYLPAANWTLCVVVLAVVLGFRTSSALSSAYGVAVSATILTTVTLAAMLTALRGARARLVLTTALGVVALVLAAATLPKVESGGWLPLGAALVLFVAMATWHSGRRRLLAQRSDVEPSLGELVDRLERGVDRRPGSAVFLAAGEESAPFALGFVLEHEGTLPEHTVVLSWRVEDSPSAPPHEEAVRARELAEGVVGVHIVLGYRDPLDPPSLLRDAATRNRELLGGFDPDAAIYYLSQVQGQVSRSGRLPRWQQRLYVGLDRLTADRAEQLTLPRDRTVVLARELPL